METNNEARGVETEAPKKELKKVGQLRPHRGHTLFKYTVATGRLIPIKTDGNEDMKKNRRIVLAEEGCLYVSALNLKNAVKQITRQFGKNVSQ
jgi:hypothetical protein